MYSKLYLCLFSLYAVGSASFTVQRSLSVSRVVPAARLWHMATKEQEDGIVELTAEEDTPKQQKQVAPFLSQGEIDPDAMPSDLSDGKEVRVIIYTVISLLPVLFLIPFMLGSRDMLASMLPPVDL